VWRWVQASVIGAAHPAVEAARLEYMRLRDQANKEAFEKCAPVRGRVALRFGSPGLAHRSLVRYTHMLMRPRNFPHLSLPPPFPPPTHPPTHPDLYSPASPSSPPPPGAQAAGPLPQRVRGGDDRGGARGPSAAGPSDVGPGGGRLGWRRARAKPAAPRSRDCARPASSVTGADKRAWGCVGGDGAGGNCEGAAGWGGTGGPAGAGREARAGGGGAVSGRAGELRLFAL
jgi:hypothetical protein